MFVDCFFFFQAEDGIRDLVRSRGLGDVYKRQGPYSASARSTESMARTTPAQKPRGEHRITRSFGFSPPAPSGRPAIGACLLYTSDAADDLLCVDLGGRRIIKKKKTNNNIEPYTPDNKTYYHNPCKP